MKALKSFFLKVFNPNTGHFIKPVVYPYNKRPRMGYVVCKWKVQTISNRIKTIR